MFLFINSNHKKGGGVMQKVRNFSEILQKYMEDVSKITSLSSEEEVEIGRILTEGEEEDRKVARRKLVMANLRLVILIAGLYVRKYSRPELLADFVQEGNFGLFRAAEKWEYRKAKFSTYASWWISQNIRRTFIEFYFKGVPFPANAFGDRRKVLVKIREIERQGEVPTPERLSEETGLPVSKVINLAFEGEEVSLNAPIRENENDREIMTRLLSQGASPEEISIEKDLARKVKRIVASLSPREAYVIEGRFLSRDEKTLEKISQEMGCSGEWVRQIESRGLAKLEKKFSSEAIFA
jgi:RNA polymerase primary sigma factor